MANGALFLRNNTLLRYSSLATICFRPNSLQSNIDSRALRFNQEAWSAVSLIPDLPADYLQVTHTPALLMGCSTNALKW
jgi:hypothetical protein